MALIRPSSLVAAVSGQVAGVVFAQGSTPSTVRTTPRQTRTRTAPSLDATARLQRLSRLFQALTPAEAQAWTTAAESFRLNNRVGIQRQRTAFELFVRMNLLTHSTIDKFTSTPPIFVQDSPLGVFSAFITTGPLFLYAIETPSLPANADYVNLWGTQPHRTNVLPSYKYWRRLATIPVGGGSPWSFKDEWEAVLSQAQTDQVVGIRANVGSDTRIPTTPQFITIKVTTGP